MLGARRGCVRGGTASGCPLHRGGWSVGPLATRRTDSLRGQEWHSVSRLEACERESVRTGGQACIWTCFRKHTVLGGRELGVGQAVCSGAVEAGCGGRRRSRLDTQGSGRVRSRGIPTGRLPSRARGRGYGRQIGAAVYDGIRAGSTAVVRETMSLAPPAQTERAQRDRAYVESNLTRGMDWRKQVSDAPPDARSLGTMESNGDKLIANRMKKRGMSWTIRGAHRMAKVVQLVHNRALAEFCRSQTRRRSARHRLEQPSCQDSDVVSETRVSDWAAASVPALSAPHSSRPWTNSLRNLVQTYLPTTLTQARLS